MRLGRGLAASIAVSALLTGCATTGPTRQAWNPTIDQRNVEQVRYEVDLAECRTYADANPEADAETAARDGAVKQGAMMGAMTVGAAVMTGGLSLLPTAAGILATNVGLGTLFGASGAADQANARYRSVVTACLQGRGYSVIG